MISFWVFFGTCNIHTVKRSMIYSSANISAKYYFAAAIKIKASTSFNLFISFLNIAIILRNMFQILVLQASKNYANFYKMYPIIPQ